MGVLCEGRVVACDASGCGNALALETGADPVRAVDDHDEWTHRDGRIFLCPHHPIRRRPPGNGFPRPAQHLPT